MIFGSQKQDNDKQDTNNSANKKGLLSRLKNSLVKTRSGLTDAVANLVMGKKCIDDELLEGIEMQLLTADVGVEATRTIIDDLTRRVSRNELTDTDALMAALAQDMTRILEPCEQPLKTGTQQPFVILVVGVNGSGKTTTIGKLARQLQGQGHSVMLAAGDTFRAAAVEQLQVWGQRNDVPVIAQQTGADSASVIFDAVQAARARKIDVLIADTAGRLQNQLGLMEELKKIKRVIMKQDDTAPHEVMLVIDSTTGQNALAQASQFNAAVGLSGITLTKLDGTAKGGIIFAIANKLQIPIRFIGVGESIDDLRPFNASDFVSALFSPDNQE